MTRSTYSLARLTVSPATFDEIKAKLTTAGYQQTFRGEGGTAIDMTGIELFRDPTLVPGPKTVLEIVNARSLPNRTITCDPKAAETLKTLKVFVPYDKVDHSDCKHLGWLVINPDDSRSERREYNIYVDPCYKFNVATVYLWDGTTIEELSDLQEAIQ